MTAIQVKGNVVLAWFLPLANIVCLGENCQTWHMRGDLSLVSGRINSIVLLGWFSYALFVDVAGEA